VAFVGKSGGGKSTIIHLLMRFYDPTAGRILLDGVDMRDINMRTLHAQMGLVAQDTQLFQGNVEDNIAYGLEKGQYTAQDLEEAARQANAWEFISRLTHGVKTRVGEKGVRLSGGQRQRIAIARVMLRKPRLLFLDEATSALDTQSEALVQAALDGLMQMEDTTIVLVAYARRFHSLLSTLTEIDLCHTCSCHEILRAETPGQAPALHRDGRGSAVRAGGRAHPGAGHPRAAAGAAPGRRLRPAGAAPAHEASQRDRPRRNGGGRARARARGAARGGARGGAGARGWR
jgi:ABC-type phosphate transport system ATPase subunit